jgi:hypothetical protein
MKKSYTLYKTSYGDTAVKIRNPWAFPKWAKANYGSKWLSNKQLIETYSKEQMLLCLNLK